LSIGFRRRSFSIRAWVGCGVPDGELNVPVPQVILHDPDILFNMAIRLYAGGLY